MMLNLTNMFSGSNSSNTSNTNSSNNSNSSGNTVNGSSSSQPVEAQLWNADLPLTSPLSPAVPRYIPAVAGSGANRRIGSDTTGRLGYGWRVGGSGSGPAEGGEGERPRFKNIASIRSLGGYSPNAVEHQRQKGNHESTLSAMTSPSLSNGAWKKSKATGIESAEGGILEMSYMNGKSLSHHHHHLQGQDQRQGQHHHRDEDLQGRHLDFDRSRLSTASSEYPFFFNSSRRALRARLFCFRQNRRLHPAVRLMVFLFLAGSVCFTTFHLIFRDSRSKDRLRKSFEYTEQQLRIRKILGPSSRSKRVISPFDVEAQNYSSHQWALDTYDITNSKATAHVNEDYMLSKAFTGVMQPTRVIPFYFRASFKDENNDDDLHEDDDDGLRHYQQDQQPGRDSSTDDAPVHVDPGLVTITTLITPDRYGVFLKLVKQYRGPISVAIHIIQGPEQDAMLHELNLFFQEHPILRTYVDLHVIIDNVDFQLNMWRNVARMFARTDYFMLLDVDFHIPSGLKNHLHHDPRIQELLSSGAALVIPAFEYSVEHDPKDSQYFPDKKADLIPLLEKKHIRVFHDSFPPGHAATDTPRWIKMGKRAMELAEPPASLPRGRAGYEEEYRQQQDDDEDAAHRQRQQVNAGEGVGYITDEEREEYLEQEASGERPYKVTKFEPKYEPYIVLKREGTPWCDERFVGYGGNKAVSLDSHLVRMIEKNFLVAVVACLFEIYVSGIDFWVMPQDFLIHQYHDYPTTNRKNGRILNKHLFVDFQQEICFRVLQRMIVTGEWYTHKADNLRHQCGAFESFLSSADQMAQEYEERHPDSLLKEPVFVADVDWETRRKKDRAQLVNLNQGGIAQSGTAGHDSGDGRKDDSDDDDDDGKGEGGRYSGQAQDRVALEEQVVDDDEHQNPFMSRPKGTVWGGIQPRTYYSTPSLPESDIPIEGIPVDVAVDGGSLSDATYKQGAKEQGKKSDLTGERLEQFRQGVILPDKDADGNGGSDMNRKDDHAAAGEANHGLADVREGLHDGTRSFEEAAERMEERFGSLGAAIAQ
ncbi:hypothetical protein EDD11_005325 [Mortierella claussenii]|nr:hypothetical protein EDD11_005325 [Mortierella claussenii]